MKLDHLLLPEHNFQVARQRKGREIQNYVLYPAAAEPPVAMHRTARSSAAVKNVLPRLARHADLEGEENVKSLSMVE